MNIANIHAMRESLSSVLDLLHNGGSELDFNWWTKVEETKWLSHLRRVLSASLRVAHAINDTAQTVIVHCSGKSIYYELTANMYTKNRRNNILRWMGSHRTDLCTRPIVFRSILSYFNGIHAAD